jgi:hypothetical protein
MPIRSAAAQCMRVIHRGRHHPCLDEASPDAAVPGTLPAVGGTWHCPELRAPGSGRPVEQAYVQGIRG